MGNPVLGCCGWQEACASGSKDCMFESSDRLFLDFCVRSQTLTHYLNCSEFIRSLKNLELMPKRILGTVQRSTKTLGNLTFGTTFFFLIDD